MNAVQHKDPVTRAVLKTIARGARGNVYLKRGSVMLPEQREELRRIAASIDTKEYIRLLAAGEK